MKVKVAQSCLTLCDPMYFTVHGILQARILVWVDFPFSRDLPNPGIEPRSPALQADSLPAEPPEKPKNTGVGALPSPKYLPNPGIELGSSTLQADSLPTIIQKHMCTAMFIAAPFIIPRTWRPPNVHQQTNGKIRCGTYIQHDII